MSSTAEGSADLVLRFSGFAFCRASFRPVRDRPSGLDQLLSGVFGLFGYALLLCGLLSCCFSWAEALVQTRIRLFMWDPGGMRTQLVQPFKLFTWKEANTQ